MITCIGRRRCTTIVCVRRLIQWSPPHGVSTGWSRKSATIIFFVTAALNIDPLSPRFVVNCYQILADRTAARSMIGYCHDNVVCLSVGRSVAMCIVALKVVNRLKDLYTATYRETPTRSGLQFEVAY